MTASELLDRIIRARILDDRTIDRLKRQVEDPAREVKPKAIIRFLLEKGFIDQGQADALLAGQELVPYLVEDEQFELPAGPGEVDSEDLTAGIGVFAEPPAPPPAAPPPPPPPAPPGPGAVQPAEQVAGAAESRSGRRERRSRRDQETRMMEPAERPPPGPSSRRRDEIAAEVPEWSDSAVAEAKPRGPASFSGKLDTADQWNTRWLWTGFGILAALLVALGVLWLGVMRTDADKLFESAELNFRNGAYGKAGDEFQKFHTRFPRNERASLARVREVNAYLRMRYEAKDFRNAHDYAIAALPGLVNEPAINEIRDDLGIMIPEIVRSFSRGHEREKTIEGVAARLEEARKAKAALLDNPEWITTTMRNSQRLAPIIAEIENDILAAEGKIQKEKDLVAATAQIQQLTTDGRTDEAFATFTRLVRVYPDLGARPELREAMARVSVREMELVRPVAERIATAPGAPPSPVTAEILSACTVGSPLGRMNGETIAVLAEGAVWGLDAGSGRVLWRHFVGLPTTIQPIWTDENARSSLIVCDQQRHLVMRVAADSGEVEWTAQMGEPFFAPRVAGDSVFVAAVSGLVVRLGVADGAQVAAARLPRRVSAGCEVADQQPWLFVTGEDSNLYVLSSDDLRCASVFYLGHPRGAIRTSPLWWSGYLLVVVNGSDYSELHVLQRAEETGNWRRVQVIRLADGPVTTPPVRMGRQSLFTSENGDIRILDMNPLEPESPVQIATEGSFAVRGGVRTWNYASGSDVWIAGMGITPLRLQRATGNLERITVKNQADVYLGPIHKRDDLLFTQRRRGGSRLTSVAAVEASTLEEKWRTDFAGSPAGAPVPGSGGLVQVTAQGNLLGFSAGPESGSAGTELARSSEIDEPLLFPDLVRFDSGLIAATPVSGVPWLLTADPVAGKARLLRLQPPAELPACPPIAVGEELIVASVKGQIMRINPSTGQFSGSPYLPPLSPGQSIQWNRPARVGSTSFLIGDGVNQVMLMDVGDDRSVRKLADRQLDGQIITGLVSHGPRAWLVEQQGGRCLLLRADVSGEGFQLAEPVGLAGLPTQDPFATESLVLVATEDGQLWAWTHDGQLAWKIPSGGNRIASVVATGNGETAVCFENGLVRIVTADGDLRTSLDLGQPIAHAPLVSGRQWLFTAADGTLLVVNQP